MSLQISVPKEIKEYKQVVAFGLTLKQLLWCGTGVAVGAGVFFLIKDKLALDLVAMICMVSAIPFALMGFVNYNGMDAWELFTYWFKVMFLMRPLKYESTNIYKDLLLSDFDNNVEMIDLKNRDAESTPYQEENTKTLPPKKPKKPSFPGFLKKYRFPILAFILLSVLLLTIVSMISRKPETGEKVVKASTTTVVTSTTNPKRKETTTTKETSNPPVGVIPLPKNSKGKATTTIIDKTENTEKSNQSVKATQATTLQPTKPKAVTTTKVTASYSNQPTRTNAPTRATAKPTTKPTPVLTVKQTESEDGDVFDPIIETLPPKN